MNIKSLLIGSAAALAAVSGAQAADAIVAAEPEPMEYVRVCDAFGAGFFYIPGTETCLQVGGEVRFQVDFGDDIVGNAAWDATTRARIHFDVRSDTEYGTLKTFIQLQATNDIEDDGANTTLRQAYIELGGFRVGSFYGWWDDDIAGESDYISNVARFNSARYTYEGGAFVAGVSLDELEATGLALQGQNEFGVTGMIGGNFGSVFAQGLVSYDNAAEEWAIRGLVTAEVGPGTFGIAGVWASDPNIYYDDAKWTIAASYEAKVSEKLTITPAISYLNDARFIDGNDAWDASIFAQYEIVQDLKAAASVGYFDEDIANDGEWRGFVRLTRAF